MKRITVVFLLLVLCCGLFACSTPLPETAETENTAAAVSSDDEWVRRFDAEREHKFIACDITNHSIVVFDLNACNGDFQKLKEDAVSVVWEWDPEEDPACKTGGPNYGIDSAKYRYSAFYERDVIIACSSNGWVGIIDYNACRLLWEYKMKSGPHSVELLPNGDLVVAVSNNPGALTYFPLSTGAKVPVHSIPSLYCHGVSWDPEREVLWVLEHDGVYAAVIENMGTMNGKIARLASGAVFDYEETGGHAFSPVYGKPGKYWASSARHLWQFDAETETLTRQFEYTKELTAPRNIKGIASFSDGTVVEAFCDIGKRATRGWSCDGLRIVTLEESTGRVKQLRAVTTDVLFDPADREFYKVQPFTKNYQ